MGVAWVGLELFTTRPAGDAMITTIWTGASSWTLTALPLFIWMGEILYRTRLSQDMFRGLAPWMRWLPGGLLHTNIAGCTIFAAVSGSSAATLTTVGKMSIPELRKRGYPEYMIIGTLAGAATLGLMIPPSLTLIVYGVSINESIIKLFMAGIVPGLVLAGLFMSYIVVWHFFRPAERPEPEPRMSIGAMFAESRFLIPVLLLVFAVIGSMYFGWATATEAAAVGVLGSLTLALFQRSLTISAFFESLMGATRTSAMIRIDLDGGCISVAVHGLHRLCHRALAAWIDAMDLSPVTLIIALTMEFPLLVLTYGDRRANDPPSWHRCNLVWHFHRCGCGDGTSYPAYRVQSVCVARHDPSRNRVYFQNSDPDGGLNAVDGGYLGGLPWTGHMVA
ncbi:C4-dicarboxylate TRAP transporter large permease protein DctM [Nymphon striatum]|nr:C4-dicarboxylate TRAP transporter large permease protein DctM [Nymphon striatum]